MVELGEFGGGRGGDGGRTEEDCDWSGGGGVERVGCESVDNGDTKFAGAEEEDRLFGRFGHGGCIAVVDYVIARGCRWVGRRDEGAIAVLFHLPDNLGTMLFISKHEENILCFSVETPHLMVPIHYRQSSEEKLRC